MSVIEAGMYFLLGLLAAGFIALLVIPAIWHRAVRLTHQRVENERPITITEIAAEKDKLRAEGALSTLLLEKNIVQLRDKANEHLITLNTKQHAFNALNAERDEKNTIIAELENREYDLRNSLLLKEEKLAQVSANLRNAQRENTKRIEALSILETKLTNQEALINQQKIEIIARNTEIEKLHMEISFMQDKEKNEGFHSTYNKQQNYQIEEIKKTSSPINQTNNKAQHIATEGAREQPISDLNIIHVERDNLQKSLTQFKSKINDPNRKIKQSENASLQEKINDLAEKIMHITPLLSPRSHSTKNEILPIINTK